MDPQELSLDKVHVDRVERGIAPPMRLAITIPVNGASGVSIYIMASVFESTARAATLREIAARLVLSPKQEG